MRGLGPATLSFPRFDGGKRVNGPRVGVSCVLVRASLLVLGACCFLKVDPVSKRLGPRYVRSV